MQKEGLFMHCQVFELDYYFSQTNVYFAFFDGLFLMENDTKNSILDSLGISSSSYRTQRLKENTNKSNIVKLLDFFDVLDLNIEDKVKYERLISKIYYYYYYKNYDKMSEQLVLINKAIEENNILKPVLVLFRVFLIMNLEYGKKQLITAIEKDLNYLKLFYKKNYFINELRFLYLIVLFSFDLGEKDIVGELDNLAIVYKNLSWLYHFTKGSKAYLRSEFAIAFLNYNHILEEFRLTNNMERYFMVTNNLAYIHNIYGEFHLSYNLLHRIVEYVFGDNYIKHMKNIVMHLFYSLFMLGRYEEIMLFSENIIFDRNILNPISSVICLIVTDKLGNKERFKQILNLNFESQNFKIFKQFFITKDKKVLQKLEDIPYPQGIKERIFIEY